MASSPIGIVALGGIADEFTRVGYELTRDRVARVFRPDEGGQRWRQADCVKLGDSLELGKPLWRDQPRFDEILRIGQPLRRSLGDHGRSSRQSRAQINPPAGADGGGPASSHIAFIYQRVAGATKAAFVAVFVAGRKGRRWGVGISGGPETPEESIMPVHGLLRVTLAAFP
jgi:hypothetical protein